MNGIDRTDFKSNIEEALHAAKKQPGRLNASLELICENCTVSPQVTIDYMYNVKELHKNPYDWLHGGIISALMDYAVGIGAVAYTGHLVATTDISVSFIKAMTAEKFSVNVEFTHIGGSRLNGIGRMTDFETKELSATAQVGFTILKQSAELITK